MGSRKHEVDIGAQNPMPLLDPGDLAPAESATALEAAYKGLFQHVGQPASR